MEVKRKKSEFRIVFLGTPDFAVESLEMLVNEGFNIVGVVTAPDRPAGRGHKLQSPAVKICAVKHNIPVLQPTNLKDAGFLESLDKLNADLQIVVAFRMLPEVVWNKPPFGTFNLHASLLPQYRGAAPINWAVINGETKTGVTTFFLKQEIDTGAIIDQKEINIPESATAGEIHDILMKVGSELVVKTVNKIIRGNVNTIDQSSISEDSLKTAPKLNRQVAKIDWSSNYNDVYNHIRGLSPHPGAWTMVKLIDEDVPKQLKILDCIKVDNISIGSGEVKIDENGRLIIGCSTGAISPGMVQLEGKKKMSITDLMNGTTLDMNYKLD